MTDKNGVERCDNVRVHGDIVEKVNKKMPDEEKLYDLSELFKVFGDSTRIKICMCFLSRPCVYAILLMFFV